MAYSIDKKTGEITISGWENGTAISPHKGIGSMKGVNISTIPSEIMVSYSRVQQSQTIIAGGTLTYYSANTLITASNILAGSWITVSGSTITNLANGTYFVYLSTDGFVRLSTGLNSGLGYAPNGENIVSTMSGGGTATFSTVFNLGEAVQDATEVYTDSSNVRQYRYYIIDTNGRLFVKDTAQSALWNWVLPYTGAASVYSGVTTTVGGLAVLNGFVFIFLGKSIYTVSTAQLGTTPQVFSAGGMMSSLNTPNSHFALSGHQGKLYYCDNNYIGSIFPNTALDATTGANVNIQSYCSYTSSSTTGTISALLSGSIPATASAGSTARIPAFFFTALGGTQPTNLTAGTKYYIDYTPGFTTYGQFNVYAAASGGSAINIQTGAAGTQYFNTFFTQSSDGATTFTFTPQRVNLPTFETSTCLVEIGNTVLIGTKSNILYPWNQVDVTPSDLIPIPENNIVKMTTVNNMVYIFAGSKGNIYVTNGSTASLVTTVPDYTSGIINPYFTWGGVMYLRGRVWFSIQDETAGHTGQCGGIWSFVPTQNFFVGQDTGLSLRMDNRYSTYNGRSTVLIPSQDQNALGAQFWDARTSSISNPAYTINFTSTTTGISAIIDTDIIPTGTVLDKKTFSQIEYKLSTPLVSGESVEIAYRTDITSAFVSCGSAIVESNTSLSGFFTVNFEKTQWLQLQITLNPITTGSSFVRLKEIYIR